jgi:predicted O-linked N-acetylglucosamine transferase (SPINDLY family)
VAKFFEPLLDAHDRDRFEVHCYYNFPIADEVTGRIRARAGHFATVWGASDGHVAVQVRRDGIDILVDLDGHTLPNRLPVFLLRPAPVQVTWLGYLATTGLPTIDYRLTDALADPRGLADALHTETLWRLPHTAWCYRPYDEAPPARRAPATDGEPTTYVSLNNPGKVNDAMLELWARILSEVAGSRLVVHVASQPSRVSGVERFFASRGIASERLLLVGRQSIGDYLRTYTRCDVALDTWPCAGGTTTCDALWMGVPVVTLAGTGSYSRTGASLLPIVGLGDLVADSPDAYVDAAVRLARDRPRLATLRQSLRNTMRSSCLTDGAAFARDVEDAFLSMWEHRDKPTQLP